MTPGEPNEGLDDQDFAEAFDETNTDEREQIGEMRTFEELPEVFDVTRRDGDRDDEEGLALDADEFDEEAIDMDSELEEDDEAHARAAPSDNDDFYDDAGNPNISGFDDDALDGAVSLEGLDEEVADADLVTGGEDDFTNFQSKSVSDEDLRRMGYLETPDKSRT